MSINHFWFAVGIIICFVTLVTTDENENDLQPPPWPLEEIAAPPAPPFPDTQHHISIGNPDDEDDNDLNTQDTSRAPGHFTDGADKDEFHFEEWEWEQFGGPKSYKEQKSRFCTTLSLLIVVPPNSIFRKFAIVFLIIFPTSTKNTMLRDKM